MAGERVSAEFDDEAIPPSEAIEPIRFDVGDLDRDADPRVDLDALVNARWRAANPVPPDRTCWDGFAILAERTARIEAEIATQAASAEAAAGSAQRIVGDFWASAMRAAPNDGLDRLSDELARIDALDSPAALAEHLRDRHARGLGGVFRFEVEPDFENPDRMIACISQGGLGLPDRDDYFDTSAGGIARRHEYAGYLAELLVLAGDDRDDALRNAEMALAFETRLAEMSLSRRTLARDIGARFCAVELDEVDRDGSVFRWRAYFAALGIDPPARFSLAPPPFHRRVAEMLADTPTAIWRTYLRCRTIDEAAPFLDDAFASTHYRFHEATMRGQARRKPRWKRALAAIDAHVGEAMGELYVARAFSPEAKRQILALVGRLRGALKRRLERVEWMGEPTRAAALRKLAAMHVKIGYPDRWHDWHGLETSRRSSLYANVLAARAFEVRRRVQRIGTATDRSLWPMPPQTVNAGYDPRRNEIVFPAAILAPPFFDPSADFAANLGGIGAVIAHEMVHAFDDQGSRFDARGRFEDWWTSEDRARFDALGARLARQFDAVRTDAGSVDGRLTLGENIADFGGLAVACDALRDALAAEPCLDAVRDGFTPMQRFFLAWATIWRQNLTSDEAAFRLRADIHAPAQVRANAAPAALDAYAKAFACEAGDPMRMSDTERVRIW